MVSTKSILNGVLGHHLEATNNELATPMTLMRGPDTPVDVSLLLEELKSKCCQNGTLPLCILLHGLVNDETSWYFDGKSYGTLLEQDIPHMTCLSVRYNTGLHISTNGETLSHLLQALFVRLHQIPLDLSLICHSMGGLVARSATQYALRHDHHWIYSLRHVIFLGTPHQGSYWECAGNVVTCALESTKCTKVAAKLAKLRSNGIKDLRYGYTTEDDRHGAHQDAWLTNTKQPETSLDWVDYHAVTGTITTNPEHPLSLLLGDGLVSKASAEGKSERFELSLEFTSTKEFAGVHHNRLHKSLEVYEQLLEWIRQPNTKRPPRREAIVPNEENTEYECVDGFVLLDGAAIRHDALLSPNNTSKLAHYRGVTALVQDAVDAGVSAVEEVQTDVTDKVYTALSPIPLVPTIHKIHSGIVSGIYKSVRGVNYASGETVKCALQTVDALSSGKEVPFKL